MPKSLVLIRHAHRELDPDDHDNALSPRGRRQAAALAAFARARGFDPSSPPRLLASPKRRARETMAPLGAAFGAAVTVDPRLDERLARETTAALDERVGAFLDHWLRSDAPLTIACGHGDWLPRAHQRLIGQSPELPHAAWLEVTLDGRAPRLAWFVPGFDWWP